MKIPGIMLRDGENNKKRGAGHIEKEKEYTVKHSAILVLMYNTHISV